MCVDERDTERVEKTETERQTQTDRQTDRQMHVSVQRK